MEPKTENHGNGEMGANRKERLGKRSNSRIEPKMSRHILGIRESTVGGDGKRRKEGKSERARKRRSDRRNGSLTDQAVLTQRAMLASTGWQPVDAVGEARGRDTVGDVARAWKVVC